MVAEHWSNLLITSQVEILKIKVKSQYGACMTAEKFVTVDVKVKHSDT